MKRYSDDGVVPQNLFQHKVAQIMSGLFSNVEMMLEDIEQFPEWAEHELGPDYSVREALDNMKTCLDELRSEQKEFVEYLNSKTL